MTTDKVSTASEVSAGEGGEPLTAKEVARWILDSVGGGDWQASCYARAEPQRMK